MNKDIIQEQLETNKSLKLIAQELETSQTNLRYWIKKLGLKKEKELSTGFCKQCNKLTNKTYCNNKCKSLYNYYNNKEKRDADSKIHSKTTRESFKIAAINYGGGKCKYCNYNKNYSALAFHHTDPTQKDFPLGGIRSLTLKENHKKELDKCILLCHNCHTKIHNSLRLLENKVQGKQSEKGQRIRRLLIEEKGSSCIKCHITGINDIFAFHHRVSEEKEFEIDARTCNGYKYERLVKEASKCDLMCHNCHMEIHYPNNILT